jgi:SulP family sulfate permease
VVLVPIVQEYGVAGLFTAGFMAGFILLLMGILKLGRLIQYIPHPVITGFTSGIALVIFTIQLKDFFGIKFAENPAHFHERVVLLLDNYNSVSIPETLIAILTLTGLIFLPRIIKKVPSPLIVLPSVTLIAYLLNRFAPDYAVSTIDSRFSTMVDGVLVSGIPGVLPDFKLPWQWNTEGVGTNFVLTFDSVKNLIPPAFTIAILAAIESLLAAMVADSMANTKHDPDAELSALGVASIIGPFLGAMPATGALARTATNIKFGARTPVSAIIHALFALTAMLLAAPVISLMPMASLAALLIIVAFNMSELHRFKMILRIAPRSDIVVLMTCFLLTVVFDMVIGVGIGMVVASFLLMRRMAEDTKGYVVDSLTKTHSLENLSPSLVPYEISGPLFFAAAEKAVELVAYKTSGKRGIVFIMDKVSSIDISAVISLESSISGLLNQGKEVYILGVSPKIREILSRSLLGSDSRVRIISDLKEITPT